jgi:hypothetical protein
MMRWLPGVLGLTSALCIFGCEAHPPMRDAVGPYSLHCVSVGPMPTCVRFHAPTGAVRRMALDRIPRGNADPDKGSVDSTYVLSCHPFDAAALNAEAQQAPSGEPAMLCLRMDTHSGEVVFIETGNLPIGL